MSGRRKSDFAPVRGDGYEPAGLRSSDSAEPTQRHRTVRG